MVPPALRAFASKGPLPNPLLDDTVARHKEWYGPAFRRIPRICLFLEPDRLYQHQTHENECDKVGVNQMLSD